VRERVHIRGLRAEYELRAATAEDFPFLVRLRAITMREYAEPIWGWDDGMQEDRFRGLYEPAAWRIIVVGGTDAGGLCIERTEEAIYLAGIYLMPDYQGRRIGSMIIRAVQHDARKSGLRVTLNVLVTNIRARRLYERQGFVAVDLTAHKLRMEWSPPDAD
jgi:ribosomal protein S18 acetylase RimI-like enzyme